MHPESDDRNDDLAGLAGRQRAQTVSELNHAVARALERGFPLVLVGGEVSNYTCAASGHWYFTLKDATAQVRCAMFRGRAQFADFRPREGDAVEVRAQVRLYEPRGEYQLVVDAIRRAGTGSLLEAFNRLKDKLAREGLFDPGRKRPLPVFVRGVAIVTSTEAAALRDVATTLAARAPHVRAVVYPTPVQGEGAAARIAAAIRRANARRAVDGLDLLIVCRGGGSIEDLWAYNEEIVARAIAASELPVVCGVGHETDVTIADFVADLRAPTPTAAAQLAVRADDDWRAALENLARHLRRAATHRWEQGALRLDAAAARLVSPARRLEVLDERVMTLGARLRATAERRAEAAASRLARLAGVLEAVSPGATLRRGYAIVERQGRVLTSVSRVSAGDVIGVRLADGTLDASVVDVRAQGEGLGV